VKHGIGIQQGRLSPRRDGRLQAFPHAAWQAEFGVAARLGFDAIEWLFEADRAQDNPVTSAAGRAEIKRVMAENGVSVRSLCASYFITHRLAGVGAERARENVRALCDLIETCAELGVQRILLPLLEQAAVDTPELRDEIVPNLKQCAALAERHGLILGLEMEIPGADYAALLERIAEPSVRAYYDTGNSTAQGFDISVDVVPLLPRLAAVHIKDRKKHAGSVPVGSGDANFDGFLRTVKRGGFCGDFVFEHFFDADPEGAAGAARGALRERRARAQKEGG
jgi:sugar phosphate isomerase/epimerase